MLILECEKTDVLTSKKAEKVPDEIIALLPHRSHNLQTTDAP